MCKHSDIQEDFGNNCSSWVDIILLCNTRVRQLLYLWTFKVNLNLLMV